MLERYRESLPLLDGAVAAVRRLVPAFTLAVASSSNRPLIEAVLGMAGIADPFAVTVSSEEVERGKPAPDVYLEGGPPPRRPAPAHCAAIRTRPAASAPPTRPGCACSRSRTALPAPPADVLALADAVIASPDELTPELVRADAGPGCPA